MVRVLALLLLAAAASAQVPRTISYQGVLEDGGTPVTTTTDLTFRLYATATGGTALWTETQTVTPDATGAFSVRLGAVAGLTGLDFDDPRWLSTEAGGTTLGPRTALDAVPYALGLYGVRVTPPANSTQGPQIAAGHPNNTTAGTGAVVSGGGTSGSPNQATGTYAAIGGGGDNLAGNNHATVSGGQGNNATGSHATVGGGFENSAGANAYATVGGGQRNSAGGGSATVGGGFENAANGDLATVGGGRNNRASGFGGTVSGGRNNGASSSWTTVGGGFGNTADRNYATVGGGLDNTANDTYATVGGGRSNVAREIYATIGGGQNNVANGIYSTVPGGRSSHARGSYSFASGFFARAAHDGAFVWSDNSLSGADSLVSTGQDQFLVRAAGGIGIGTNAPGAQVHVEVGSSGSRPHLLLDETATGGFARLRMANANAAGAHWDVAAGGSGGDAFNMFYWDGASGTNVVGLNAPGVGSSLITTSSGASLSQGGTWVNASSRALKTDFLPVDPEAVLATLAELPITRWRYRAEADDVWHLGPVSQDFHAAFGLGASTEAIGTVDADGVALAATQGLYALAQRQAAQIENQQAQIDALRAELRALVDVLGLQVAASPSSRDPADDLTKAEARE